MDRDNDFSPDGVLNEAREIARDSRDRRARASRAAAPQTVVVPPPRRYVRGTMPSLQYAPVFLKMFFGAAAFWFGTLFLLSIMGISGAIWLIYIWVHQTPPPPRF